MPRKRKRQRKREEEHMYLAIRVEHYEARVEAAINHHVYAPQYVWDLDNDDPLYKFTTQLTIVGISTYPKERAGEAYELTIYGNDSPSRRLNAIVKDAQARNEHGSPQYREYRGRQIPVYDPPKGIGHLNKVRGEPRRTAWLFAAPRFVNDTLVLLGHRRNLYLAIRERKDNRARWIQGVTLQTTDPEEE